MNNLQPRAQIEIIQISANLNNSKKYHKGKHIRDLRLHLWNKESKYYKTNIIK